MSLLQDNTVKQLTSGLFVMYHLGFPILRIEVARAHKQDSECCNGCTMVYKDVKTKSVQGYSVIDRRKMGKQSKSKHRDARTPPTRPSPRTVPLHLPPKNERDARAQYYRTPVCRVVTLTTASAYAWWLEPNAFALSLYG